MNQSLSFRRVFPLLLGGLAVCLLAVSAAAGMLACLYGRRQLALLDGFCTALVTRAPETADAMYALAKEGGFTLSQVPGVLAERGYRSADFAAGAGILYAAAAAGLALGLSLLAGAVLYLHRRTDRQLQSLTALLEAARTGKPCPPLNGGPAAEGSYARLADELEKTVTELTLTRESAVDARNAFAQNLANIAHQLKTPLTALSLAAQDAGAPTRRAMEPQLDRLTRLEESLLLLARLDAGTLPLHPEPSDLFTLLMMAADNLLPLAEEAGVAIDVAEADTVSLPVDPDWTTEAFLNLMKNCVEHAPAGSTVYCTYIRNPLYTEVCIRDEGNGFSSADLGHLFERFYRGTNARPQSTGIGLSIAKELLERQNALLTAENAPEGGGRFVVRFYR